MHIFRHVEQTASALELGREVATARAGGDRLALLMAAARLECSLVDHWSADADDWDERREALSCWTRAAAAHYLDRTCAIPLPSDAQVQRLLSHVGHHARLRFSDPEGLKYYALWPAGYAAAARAWQHGAGDAPACVIGLRTMGCLLAAVVGAALEPRAGVPAHGTLTLRPRGEAWRRSYRLTPRLQGILARWPGTFLIVDEGPGLSGSSFAGAVALLVGLGVAAARVVLMPSWRVDEAAAARLHSPAAARGFTQWRCHAAAPLPSPGGHSLHGGAWRPRFGHRDTPVWAAHERLKFSHAGQLIKFAGFGPYGRATWGRAQRMAQAGWGPQLVSGEREAAAGWVRYQVARARPLPARPSRALAEWMGAYLAWRRREFAQGPAAPPSAALTAMLATNLDRLQWRRAIPAAAAAVPVWADGRLQRCEWGVPAQGWIKFDGTDHGDDPFFPGLADIAWDLAGLGVEFGPAFGAAAAAAYCRDSGELASRLAPRLAWHRLAYTVFWRAYCQFAAGQTPAPEARRFRLAARRYREASLTAAG